MYRPHIAHSLTYWHTRAFSSFTNFRNLFDEEFSFSISALFLSLTAKFLILSLSFQISQFLSLFITIFHHYWLGKAESRQ